jgi:long-chain acyl-CoA synthetase
VLEAAVFGVPDDQWGEAVHAVVVPRPGHQVDPQQLIAFCRKQIAGYKVPRTVDVRHEPLPKSGPGKVLKRELRAPYWKVMVRNVH